MIKEGYLLILKLNDIVRRQCIKITVDKIHLTSNYEQPLIFENIENCFHIEKKEKDNTCIVNLYINCPVQNYLDEDYEISSITLNVVELVDGKEMARTFTIIHQEAIENYNKTTDLKFDMINYSIISETVCIKGDKPPELYGYDLKNPNYQKLARKVADKIEGLINDYDINYFLTSGELGGPTIGFYSVDFLKRKYPNIKNILIIPFKKIDDKWGMVDKDRLKRAISKADLVLYCDEHFKDKDFYSGYSVEPPSTAISIGEYSPIKYQYNDIICDKLSVLSLYVYKDTIGYYQIKKT